MEKYEIQKLRELPIEKIAKEMGMKVEHHKALCPFHDDHHASLMFSKTKNSCRCYVCMRSSIGTIDLSTFTLNKVYELPIELPSDIRLLDNITSITVSFDSSKLETKTMNLPSECVQVVNLPSTYTLTVETERLMNVTLCGPAGLLDTLVPEQVVIEIDADDFYVAAGQQNIACRLYVPSNGKIFALGSYVIQCKIESN